MKLCKDCRWYIKNRDDAGLSDVECNNPGNQQPNYVTGGTRVFYLTCAALRMGGGMCGHDAKWFEPVPTTYYDADPDYREQDRQARDMGKPSEDERLDSPLHTPYGNLKGK